MSYKNDFPIFKNNPGLTYLDSAATSQKPRKVIDTIMEYYEKLNANVHRGIYPLSEKSTEIYELARAKVARFINANSPKEIIFVRNTTEAINLVAMSWAKDNLKKGDTILISEMEHHSNLVPWQVLAKEKKLKLVYIDVKNFKLDLEDLNKKLIAYSPSLISITHASNTLGTVNPIKQIARQIHKKGGLILVDGAQAVPHMTVDVKNLGVDFYAFSGHKMLAPMGIGVLYAREELLGEMKPFLTGGGMIGSVEKYETEYADIPEKFEAGTPNVAGAVGLAGAIDYLEGIGMQNVKKHEIELTKYAIRELKKIKDVSIIGSESVKDRLGVLSFSIEGVHAHDIAQVLAGENIAIRAGHHCNHVLMKEVLKVPATARASFYIYNDKNDVKKLVRAVKKVIEVFKE